jgi:threonine synthase
MPFTSHLESALDGTRFPADRPAGTHKDRPLWVRYDMARVRESVRREDLAARPKSLWRYRELLPTGNEIEPVTLGEGMTPLLPCPRLGARLGVPNLWIKDESQLPTGSFKSRGMALAVSMARHFGARRLAVPTAGNAGGALASYAARAGIECFVFMPADTPVINAYECQLAGARTFLVDGLITDCGRLMRSGTVQMGWFDVSTLREPYRIEGKKTMGLELAEQSDWRLPDVVLYPTGGGTGLIGMWKAFAELAELGWLESTNRPRMVAVQSDGCAPIVRAFEQNARFAEPFPDAHTIASGLRVPAAVGDFMILDAVRESHGTAIAVDESRLIDWMRLANQSEGISVCPEAAACVGAAQHLARSGFIRPADRVVLFNTAAAQKYPEAISAPIPRLSKDQPIDWNALEKMDRRH